MSYPQFTILNVSCCRWEWMFRTFWTLWDYGSIVTPYERIDKAKYIRSSKKVSPNIVSTDTHTSTIIRFKSRGKKVAVLSESVESSTHPCLFQYLFVTLRVWMITGSYNDVSHQLFNTFFLNTFFYGLLFPFVKFDRWYTISFQVLVGNHSHDGKQPFGLTAIFQSEVPLQCQMIFNQVHRYEVILYLILLWNSVLVIYVISQQCKRKDMRSCIPSAIGIVNSMQVGLSLSQSSVFSQLSYYSC